jgi:hypothetical protein
MKWWQARKRAENEKPEAMSCKSTMDVVAVTIASVQYGQYDKTGP